MLNEPSDELETTGAVDNTLFSVGSESRMLMPTVTSSCPKCRCCGALVPEDFDNCNAMFSALLEREYSDTAFGEAHLFTVDAYALQHSEEHGPCFCQEPQPSSIRPHTPTPLHGVSSMCPVHGEVTSMSYPLILVQPHPETWR